MRNPQVTAATVKKNLVPNPLSTFTPSPSLLSHTNILSTGNSLVLNNFVEDGEEADRQYTNQTFLHLAAVSIPFDSIRGNSRRVNRWGRLFASWGIRSLLHLILHIRMGLSSRRMMIHLSNQSGRLNRGNWGSCLSLVHSRRIHLNCGGYINQRSTLTRQTSVFFSSNIK